MLALIRYCLKASDYSSLNLHSFKTLNYNKLLEGDVDFPFKRDRGLGQPRSVNLVLRELDSVNCSNARAVDSTKPRTCLEFEDKGSEL